MSSDGDTYRITDLENDTAELRRLLGQVQGDVARLSDMANSIELALAAAIGAAVRAHLAEYHEGDGELVRQAVMVDIIDAAVRAHAEDAPHFYRDGSQ